MTIYYSPKLQNIFINMTIARNNNAVLAPTQTVSRGLTLFDGAQPSAANLITNWASTYLSNYLIHWTNVKWGPAINANTVPSNIWTILAPPTTRTANASGTATWGVYWESETAIPTSISTSTWFIIGPVSNLLGSGMFRLPSTSLTSGTSYSITDGSLTFNLPNLV